MHKDRKMDKNKIIYQLYTNKHKTHANKHIDKTKIEIEKRVKGQHKQNGH
jgi:hypothetical protein